MRGLLGLIFVLCWVAACEGAWIFDGRPSSWEGIPEELKGDEFVFPVFLLELGGAWTDFEIKASTNNFESLVYYYKSWTGDQDATRGDPDARVLFTDDHGDDVRVWRLKPADMPVSSQLVSSNSVVRGVVFQPSRDCGVPAGEWMSAGNSNLVWGFVRVDDLDFERNASGTRQRWNAVLPAGWRAERLEP